MRTAFEKTDSPRACEQSSYLQSVLREYHLSYNVLMPIYRSAILHGHDKRNAIITDSGERSLLHSSALTAEVSDFMDRDGHGWGKDCLLPEDMFEVRGQRHLSAIIFLVAFRSVFFTP